MRIDFPLRTLDANLNRFKEGIRVVEDILRYEFNSPLSKELKNLRHIRIDIDTLSKRDINNDILKSSIQSEHNRNSLKDIIIANMKRAQESARVLEEIFKLENLEISERFKQSRYKLYQLEKEILEIIKTQKGENHGFKNN